MNIIGTKNKLALAKTSVRELNQVEWELVAGGSGSVPEGGSGICYSNGCQQSTYTCPSGTCNCGSNTCSCPQSTYTCPGK